MIYKKKKKRYITILGIKGVLYFVNSLRWKQKYQHNMQDRPSDYVAKYRASQS